MRTTEKPFSHLIANDLMSRTVEIIPQEMSLRGAARLLSQGHISGAPVIDNDGHCVGVLSSTDFMHLVEKGETTPKRRPIAPPHFYSAWQVVDPDELPVSKVRDLMTPDPVIARPSAGIGELAQKMVDAHVHRIIIVDEHSRPIGIVSTTDILAAVAGAGDAVAAR